MLLSPYRESATRDYDLDLMDQSEDPLFSDEQIHLTTIFDKYPSKRKLIRDTKKIKVTFG